MKIPLITDKGLSQAIADARYNLRHPEKFLERWRQDTNLRQAVIETQALQLSMLLELQHRRRLHGALDLVELEAF